MDNWFCLHSLSLRLLLLSFHGYLWSLGKKDWLKPSLSTILFIIIAFIIQPTWFTEWMTTKPNWISFPLTHLTSTGLFLKRIWDIREKLSVILAYLYFTSWFSFKKPQRFVDIITFICASYQYIFFFTSILKNGLDPWNAFLPGWQSFS